MIYWNTYDADNTQQGVTKYPTKTANFSEKKLDILLGIFQHYLQGLFIVIFISPYKAANKN